MKRHQLNLAAIASLLLVLNTSAMAEAIISGTVDQSYEHWVTHSNSGANSLNKLGSTLANYNSLSIKGNEELSDGMKATYELSFKNLGAATSTNSTTAAPTNYLAHVGLEGSFGKVKLGQQWRPMFTAVAAIDPTELAAVPGFAGAGKSGTGLSGLAPEPSSNTLTYNLPNFMPGLFVQVQKGFNNGSTTVGQGDSYGAFAILTNGDTFYIAYAMNSQKMVAGEKFMASATGTDGMDASLNAAAILGSTGRNHRLYAGSSLNSANPYAGAFGGETRDSSGVAGYYKIGSVKLVGGHVTESVAGTSAKLSMDVWGLKVPVGDAVNLGLLVSRANHTNSAGGTFVFSGNKLLATYNFSKRTVGYYTKGYQKLDGGTAAGNEFSTGVSALGLKHNF